MKNEQYVFMPFSSEEGKPNRNLREMLNKYLYHWPLFVVSLLIAFSLAFYYLGHKKPSYHVRAKLSIRDEKKTTVEKAALQELNLSSTPKLAESEIEVLKSRPVVREVVNKLQLWVNYIEPTGKYSFSDLYKSSPVRFRLLEQAGIIPERTFTIIIEDAGHFLLAEPEQTPVRIAFSSKLRNTFGTWRLDPDSNLEAYIGKKIEVRINNPEKVISQYQTNIAVALNKDAPIVELSVDDEVPERGEDVLNSLISSYKSFNILEKNKETENTLKFIDERLASLTGELTDVEKNVEGYKSSVGLTDISSKSKFYLENVQSNDARLNEVNVQLNVIEGVEKYVNASNGGENIPATIGITDPNLINLVDQLTKLQLQRDKLLATTPESNPIFVPINRQITSTKEAIRENVRGIKSSLLTTRRQLQRINSTFESSIKDLPGQERQYVSIKRQQGIKEGLYIYLLQQREQVALSYASTLADARTVESAYYEEPQSRTPFILSFALIFGLVIPAGWIYGRDAIRNRVLSRREIEAVTSVPIMSELIQGNNSNSIVVTPGRSTFAIGEQFRALRTNLVHAYNHNSGDKVALFTSSIAGEGKSFVASNVAVSLAISGRKTVILELDLRKPKIGKIFKLDASKPGLTDLLLGETSKDQVLQRTVVHDNLFAMRSGAIPDNPSELLSNARMGLLIEQLRKEFDNVIIDSPPIRLVTDALILAKYSDVTLYLVRQGYTGKSELEFIRQLYEEQKLPAMNIVFNGINKGKYGYGYAYDYSYYNKKERESLVLSVNNILTRF